jgi:hypothetical protein
MQKEASQNSSNALGLALGGQHTGPILTRGQDASISSKRFFVYVHRRLDTFAIFYVGKGTMPMKYPTPCRARSEQARNPYWVRVVNKCGGFIAEIVDYYSTEETAFSKEKELIALYGRVDTGRGILCNLTDGGDGSSGYVASEALREKRRSRRGPLSPRWGTKWSEEQKKAWSVIRKGRRHKPAAKEKVRLSLIAQYAAGRQPPRCTPVIDRISGEFFRSEAEAAKKRGILRQTLRTWLTGFRKNKSELVYASSVYRTEKLPWAC